MYITFNGAEMAVVKATGYRLDGRGIEAQFLAQTNERLLCSLYHPDRPCAPGNHLAGIGVLSRWVKAAGALS
jgi:hypothetical protein